MNRWRHRWLRLAWPILLGLVVGLWGCMPTVPPRPAATRPEPAKPTSLPLKKPPANRPRPYQVFGVWYQPLSHSKGFWQQGIASWYGDDFHGKPTSSGVPYNMFGISAAHKILPLGTWVRVRNLDNDRTIDLQINDRGPFVPGRVIDLSYGAARRLGVVAPGTAPVEIIALGHREIPKPKTALKPAAPVYRPVDIDQGTFTVQVGVFGERKNAEALLRRLARSYEHASIKPVRVHNNPRTMYRVVVGRCDSLASAERYERFLRTNGYPDAFTVAD